MGKIVEENDYVINAKKFRAFIKEKTSEEGDYYLLLDEVQKLELFSAIIFSTRLLPSNNSLTTFIPSTNIIHPPQTLQTLHQVFHNSHLSTNNQQVLQIVLPNYILPKCCFLLCCLSGCFWHA